MPSWVENFNENKPKNTNSYAKIANPLKIDEHETIVNLQRTRKSAEKQWSRELLASIDQIESAKSNSSGVITEKRSILRYLGAPQTGTDRRYPSEGGPFAPMTHIGQPK